MRRWIATGWLIGTVLVSSANPARACGPGVHVREADRTYERIVLADPKWADLAAEPLARAYVRLGAIAPDFQWAVAGLGFGHAPSLSDHLLDRASASGDSRWAWFALGHLAHVTSDPSCEMFLTPTVFASVPLGMIDLVQGDDDPQGEAEGIVEGFGDLILGRWDALVDLVYDFWADGDEAKDRGREAFLWYCTEGAAFSGTGTNCQAALKEFEGLLSRAEPILSGLSREDAKDLVHNLLSQPLDALAELFTSGFLSSLIGGQGEPTPWAHDEVQRLLATPLGDVMFWNGLYEEHFAELGPTWTLDRAANRPPSGWPGWSGNAVVCGNIESVMQFLPQEFTVHPGWIVDGVWWRDGAGNPMDSVKPGQEGDILVARIRCYSALPFEGTLRAEVRKDSPGFGNDHDDIVGEVVIPVAEDPFAATWTPRTEFDVPFVADTNGAVGFYLELYANDDDRPWFTTSWDRLWMIQTLDLWRPQYRDNFGTYGHWPPSLRVAEPDEAPASLFVWVRSRWDLDDLAGAWVEVLGREEVVRTGANGIAVLDRLPPGLALVRVGAPGHAVGGPWSAMLAPGDLTWLDVVLDRLPYQGVEIPARTPWTRTAPLRAGARGSSVPDAMGPDTVTPDAGQASLAEDAAMEIREDHRPPSVEGVVGDGPPSDVPGAEDTAGSRTGGGGGCRASARAAGGWFWAVVLVAWGWKRRFPCAKAGPEVRF